MIVYLTRRERFNAAHRLFRPEWSDEKNFEVFGKCANPKWHGHNYVLFITISGKVNPELGYVVDLKDLSRLIREKVIDHIDHKNINLEVGFMNGKMASTENIAIAIWEELEPGIRRMGVKLHCVRLEETENNFVEYYGSETP